MLEPFSCGALGKWGGRGAVDGSLGGGVVGSGQLVGRQQRHLNQFPPGRQKSQKFRFSWVSQVWVIIEACHYPFTDMSVIDVDAPSIGLQNTHSSGVNFTKICGLCAWLLTEYESQVYEIKEEMPGVWVLTVKEEMSQPWIGWIMRLATPSIPPPIFPS